MLPGNPPAVPAPTPAPSPVPAHSANDIFAHVWNWVKGSASFIWHVIGGSVTGAILPTVYQSALTGNLTMGGVVSTVVAGLVGAFIGYAQHSSNQQVAAAAAQITPAIQAQIDARVTAALSKVVKVLVLGLLLLGTTARAQNVTEIVPFPIAFSDNFVDMGGGVYKNVPAASFGYSISVANMTGLTVNRSIGLYYEGLLSNSVNPGNNTLLWSDFGPIISEDGFALKLGFQVSGQQQGTGFFFGVTWLPPIPSIFNGFGIKL